MERNRYYVVRDKALPEILQKVADSKKLLETDQTLTVQEAAERVGLSRSSFYKYKDDIAPFSDNTRGKTITLVIQMQDEGMTMEKKYENYLKQYEADRQEDAG